MEHITLSYLFKSLTVIMLLKLTKSPPPLFLVCNTCTISRNRAYFFPCRYAHYKRQSLHWHNQYEVIYE